MLPVKISKSRFSEIPFSAFYGEILENSQDYKIYKIVRTARTVSLIDIQKSIWGLFNDHWYRLFHNLNSNVLGRDILGRFRV